MLDSELESANLQLDLGLSRLAELASRRLSEPRPQRSQAWSTTHRTERQQIYVVNGGLCIVRVGTCVKSQSTYL